MESKSNKSCSRKKKEGTRITPQSTVLTMHRLWPHSFPPISPSSSSSSSFCAVFLSIIFLSFWSQREEQLCRYITFLLRSQGLQLCQVLKQNKKKRRRRSAWCTSAYTPTPSLFAFIVNLHRLAAIYDQFVVPIWVLTLGWKYFFSGVERKNKAGEKKKKNKNGE